DSFARGVGDPEYKPPRCYSYADALYERLKEYNTKLEIKKISKGGITTKKFIANYLEKTTKFMKSHKGLIKLVTITIGKNDFTGCSNSSKPNISVCLQRKLEKITYNLNNTIIPMLKKAGGKGVQYVATTYFNSFPDVDLLADKLISVYMENGFKVVDLRNIITNDTVCNYTLWCNYNKRHPNVAGSRAISNVLFSNLSVPL
ncbi:13614_t:CDS:1, partial [Dentiscutata heterogama]